jgi:hypothetical protein
VTQPDGAPKARSSHAVAVVGTKAYVFGGEFEPRVPLDNEVHVFDLDSRTWSVMEVATRRLLELVWQWQQWMV